MFADRRNVCLLLVMIFLSGSILAAPRNSGSFQTVDKANSLEINIVRKKGDVPGILEFRIEISNTKSSERTVHGKITIQDGSGQKECTVYMPLPPSANAVDTIRCQASDSSYWQFEVIKVYDFILE
tara:strand:- start:280881 stop:281258 length:378 start_codon:yes stop_codon:yes gene_type:complete